MTALKAAWRNPPSWTGEDPCEWQGVTCGIITEGMFFKSEAKVVTSISLKKICSSFSEDDQHTCVLDENIGKLKDIKHLYLNGNDFHGEIPDALSALKNIQSIYLNANKLTGEIPASLGNLQMLEKLYLNSNELSGTIPASLGNARNLHQLELQQNELHGMIPEELSNLRSLVQLDLNGKSRKVSCACTATVSSLLWPMPPWRPLRAQSGPCTSLKALARHQRAAAPMGALSTARGVRAQSHAPFRVPQTTSWRGRSPRRWAT